MESVISGFENRCKKSFAINSIAISTFELRQQYANCINNEIYRSMKHFGQSLFTVCPFTYEILCNGAALSVQFAVCSLYSLCFLDMNAMSQFIRLIIFQFGAFCVVQHHHGSWFGVSPLTYHDFYFFRRLLLIANFSCPFSWIHVYVSLVFFWIFFCHLRLLHIFNILLAIEKVLWTLFCYKCSVGPKFVVRLPLLHRWRNLFTDQPRFPDEISTGEYISECMTVQRSRLRIIDSSESGNCAVHTAQLEFVCGLRL